jgi:voltage-gated potassium channel
MSEASNYFFAQSMLDNGHFPSRKAVIYRTAVCALSLAGTAVAVAGTLDDMDFLHGPIGHVIEWAAIIGLGIDLFLQAWRAVMFRHEGVSPFVAWRQHQLGMFGLIDILAVVPFVLAEMEALPEDWRTVFGVLRFLKLARYSPALETVGSVISRESRPLQSATFIMALLMLSSSTALFLVERTINPRAFGSIPSAMWWSVATLTTLGYGDVVPITPLGKFLGGITALLGVGMFALPASIMATGFAEEVKRRDFLTVWHMVAKVPFFAGLDAEQIASITSLLRVVTAAPGDVLIREGDIGDRMYFIVSGLVAVEFGGKPIILKDGEFFGEIALLHNSPRTATVTARSRCQLLTLAVQDFRDFLDGSPRIAEAMAKTANQRLSEQARFDGEQPS